MSDGEIRATAERKRRVLVVDDEPDVRQSAKMMLEFLGYDVAVSGSGEHALNLFRSGDYEAVVTDYAMPGMKGDQLAECIKEISPACPVVMITAYAEMLRSSGKEMPGVLCVLPKPFLLEQLRTAMAKIWPDEADRA